jgi:hypothetical protein
LYPSNMEYHRKASFAKTTWAHTQSTSKIALENLIQNYDSIQNSWSPKIPLKLTKVKFIYSLKVLNISLYLTPRFLVLKVSNRCNDSCN